MNYALEKEIVKTICAYMAQGVVILVSHRPNELVGINRYIHIAGSGADQKQLVWQEVDQSMF
ncbi:hypothetical protein FC83_GL001402 [Agrilactobacillus composti DSM 18527 = JCM 14202]|uniref:Uncharacterized protein n=1 Tax=Agrilactobacillus composti DSM 18527 = JCM 14202 TaxID=1423734 RepID=X0QMJ0_9LACO|nr:hypothetical protein FC83_GL001402 [Agrilactobacillus composti DSM 18527 = JCM 14202]GAF39845.1 hypothetical protein JCM14202_1721 [Agrilactobacillus composti DSM 18527 = JCM 14202]